MGIAMLGIADGVPNAKLSFLS